uniref:Uncharacterized protein n=1 Tax=Rhizophora mucronata TaxID=61149 RepID=A0A2P2NVR8_RHIMU
MVQKRNIPNKSNMAQAGQHKGIHQCHLIYNVCQLN